MASQTVNIRSFIYVNLDGATFMPFIGSLAQYSLDSSVHQQADSYRLDSNGNLIHQLDTYTIYYPASSESAVMAAFAQDISTNGASYTEQPLTYMYTASYGY